MNLVKVISGLLAVSMLSGCVSVSPTGSAGPKLVSSSRVTESGHSAQVGVQFTSWGDLSAIGRPSRWKAPLSVGGSLSWLNPIAWSDDAGRTGRILIGEMILVGTLGAALGGGSSGGGSNDGAGDDGGSSVSVNPSRPNIATLPGGGQIPEPPGGGALQ